MTGSVKQFGILAMAALCVALAGCLSSSPSASDEERDPHFVRAKSLVTAMDYAGAIECFEKALQTNPKSGAAHYELALLYYQKELDPAAAIYHCQQYLKLRPGAQNSQTVTQVVLSCKQELARTVSLGPISEKQQRDLEKSAEEKQQLVEENRRLTEQLQRFRQMAAGGAAPTLAARTEEAPQMQRTEDILLRRSYGGQGGQTTEERGQKPANRGQRPEDIRLRQSYGVQGGQTSGNTRPQVPALPEATAGRPTSKDTSNKIQPPTSPVARGQLAENRGQRTGDVLLRQGYGGQGGPRTQEYASTSSGKSSKPAKASVPQDTRRLQTSATSSKTASRPSLASAPLAVPSTASRGRAYTVRPGDTAFVIAKRNGVKLGALLESNPGMDPRRLRAGQLVSIPTVDDQPVGRRDRSPAVGVQETRLAFNR